MAEQNQPQQQPQQRAKLHPVFERWLKEIPNEVAFDEQNNRFIIKESGDTFMPSGEYIAPQNASYQSAFDIASQYQRILNHDTIPENQRSSNIFFWQGQPRSLYRSPSGTATQGIGKGGQYHDMNQAIKTREAKLTEDDNVFSQVASEANQTRQVPLSQGEALGLLGGIALTAGGGLYAAHKTGFGPWALYQTETALTHMSPRKWLQWSGAFPHAKGMFKPQPYNLALDPSGNYQGNFLFKGLEKRRGTNLQNYLSKQFPGVKLESVGNQPITGRHGFLRLRWGADKIPGAERFKEAMPVKKVAETVATEATKETAEQASARAAKTAGTALGRNVTQAGSLYSIDHARQGATAAKGSVLMRTAPQEAGKVVGRNLADDAARQIALGNAQKDAVKSVVGMGRGAGRFITGAGLTAGTTFVQLMLSPKKAQGGMTPWASEEMYRQQERQLMNAFNGYVAEVMKAPTKAEMHRRAMQLTKGNEEAARIITNEAVRIARERGRALGFDQYESVLSPARR